MIISPLFILLICTIQTHSMEYVPQKVAEICINKPNPQYPRLYSIFKQFFFCAYHINKNEKDPIAHWAIKAYARQVYHFDTDSMDTGLPKPDFLKTLLGKLDRNKTPQEIDALAREVKVCLYDLYTDIKQKPTLTSPCKKPQMIDGLPEGFSTLISSSKQDYGTIDCINYSRNQLKEIFLKASVNKKLDVLDSSGLSYHICRLADECGKEPQDTVELLMQSKIIINYSFIR